MDEPRPRFVKRFEIVDMSEEDYEDWYNSGTWPTVTSLLDELVIKEASEEYCSTLGCGPCVAGGGRRGCGAADQVIRRSLLDTDGKGRGPAAIVTCSERTRKECEERIANLSLS